MRLLEDPQVNRCFHDLAYPAGSLLRNASSHCCFLLSEPIGAQFMNVFHDD